MSAFPIIFPSLSRQPSMDSTKTTEDDTIRDQAESGYVSTRPRYTRTRRTWKQNVRNLVLEDIRALDEFFMLTTARGGNSFLYPNLLPNWSFEFPTLTSFDLVFGWNVVSGTENQEAIGINTTTVEDGTQAIQFGTVAASTLAASAQAVGQLSADKPIPCKAGEVYLFTGGLNTALGTLTTGELGARVGITFLDATQATISSLAGTAATIVAGWQTYGFQFTIPTSAVAFTISLFATVTNTSGSTLTLDGSASVTWDEVACALYTQLTPYGRMVGSTPLGCYVRFSKLPEFSDIGWGGGVKVYGVNFELTEV